MCKLTTIDARRLEDLFQKRLEVMEKSYLFPLFLGIWQVFTLYFSMLGAHRKKRIHVSASALLPLMMIPPAARGPKGRRRRDRGNFLFSPLRMEIHRFIAGKMLHVTAAPTLFLRPVLCETAKNNSWYMWYGRRTTKARGFFPEEKKSDS